MPDKLKSIATCPIHDINPMAPEVLKSPWLMNERLRNEALFSTIQIQGYSLFPGMRTFVNMAKDHETFSSRMLSSSRAFIQQKTKNCER